MSTDSKIWFGAHLGVSIAVAAIVVASFALLFANSNLLTLTIHAPIILLFVMPGALLVFGINHLILWRRKPRVFRVADKIVIVIVVVLTAVTFLSSFSEEIGIGLAFYAVPLLMVAGVVSTIVLAVGNSRSELPPLLTTPVEPGSAPVAATLDQLFTEQPATPAPAPVAAPTPPSATKLGESPYGPQS